MPLGALEHRLQRARPDPAALRSGLQALRRRLERAMHAEMQRRRLAFERVGAHLGHLDPRQVLERGYSIVTTVDGRIVRAAAQLARGDSLRLEFARGRARAHVDDVEP